MTTNEKNLQETKTRKRIKLFPYDTIAAVVLQIILFSILINKRAHGELKHEDLTPGYWTPHTANVDWCEKNYNVSYFIAEFFNVLTNIHGILMPIWALVCWKGRSILITISAVGLSLTGISSGLFHGTLKRIPQLMDQFSMLIYLLPLIIFTQTVFLSDKQKILFYKILGAITISAACSMIFVPSCGWIFHVFFVSLMAYGTINSMFILRKFSNDENLIYIFKHTCWPLIFASSFWMIDRGFCVNIHIHAHAFWHVFIYYTAFQLLQLCFYISAENIKVQRIFNFIPLIEHITLKKNC